MTWYTGDPLYDTLLIIGFAYAALVLVGSFFGTAAYGGRFGGGKRAKGLKLGAKQGWVLMELPGLIVFPVVFFMGSNADQPVPLFFLAIWMMHYTNRALITPLLMRVQPGSQASFSFGVVIAGWVTLFLHGYFNAAYLTELGTQYTYDWFTDPRFRIGFAIYIVGFVLNIHSDRILRNLRSPNPSPDEPLNARGVANDGLDACGEFLERFHQKRSERAVLVVGPLSKSLAVNTLAAGCLISGALSAAL